jgi:tetratricopeptide (TPR) repeat protein
VIEEKDLTINQAQDLACEFFLAERYEEAEGLLRGILKLEADNFEAICRLGAVLSNRKRWYEALYCFWRALKMNRRAPVAMSNYGMVLGELGHHEESAEWIGKAVYLDPNNAITWNNFGNTLERLGRYDEALEAIEKSLALDPRDAMSHCNRGVILRQLNQRDEALRSFEACLAIKPDYADAHYNRACVLLSQGEFKEGFAEYEWRLKTAETAHYYAGPFKEPQWTGVEPLEGKTLLVYAEQGIGDAIQFMRYIPMVLDRCARVLLVVHSPMCPLIQPHPRVTLQRSGEKLGNFDYWSPLLSLAHCFGTTMETIPLPYFPHPVKTCDNCEYWYDIIPPKVRKRPDLRVGVCWAGNFQHRNDRNRSIPLGQFAKLFSVHDVEFYSLQYVRGNEKELFTQISHQDVIDLEPELHDFDDTAHAIARLDLVISVDTSVAHLSASLGIPTWILLPEFGTDWRWLLDRDTSPWYPSVKLFRQPKVGDWDTVIRQVKKQLSQAVLEQSKSAAQLPEKSKNRLIQAENING